jgi:Tfp pilus assembly protein PilV
MGKSKTDRRRGTSLIELLVAIVFLSVCVVPMLRMVVANQMRSNEAAARGIALAMAQDEICLQRRTAKTTRPTVGTTTQTQEGVAGLKHAAKMTVVTKAVAGLPDLYEVTVRVDYDDAGHFVRLSTKLRYG